MTKTNSKVWLSWLAAGGLSGLFVAAGCGKNNWSAGAEAGAGGAMGGRVGSLDASQADVPSTTGGGGAGSGGIGGSVIVDAPLATAGRVGTGGASSSGLGGMAGTSATLGGAGGVGAITGGSDGGPVTGVDARTLDVPAGSGGTGAAGGGGSLSLGGAGGAGLGGAGGVSNTGGRPTGGLFGSGGIGGTGGRGGSTSAGGATTSYDAGIRDGAWWANDAGIKVCPSNINLKKCDPGGPSICVVAGSYDAYHCSQTGYWEKDPDSCPGLLTTGDTCTGQFTCLYPSYWYCSCPGMGFPAACGDVRTMGLLDPRDGGPAPEAGAGPPPVGPCPDDVQTATCTWELEHFCVLPNGLELCRCDGTWTCSVPGCPAAPVGRMECSIDAGTLLMCKSASDANTVCYCNIYSQFTCGRI